MNSQVLSIQEKLRYERQLLLPHFGEKEQLKLKQKTALVVGAGGLGSPILYYLAAAGIGKIKIIDDDVVSISNLQRQILYTEKDLGKAKCVQAKKRIKELNNDCIIEVFNERFSKQNAYNISLNVDIIIDGTDNLNTRLLMDEVAGHFSIPYIYGAIENWIAQCSVFHYKDQTSYKDLFTSYRPEEKETKRPIPVLGACVGIIASIIATESIKILLDLPSSLSGKLLLFDTYSLEQTIFNIEK